MQLLETKQLCIFVVGEIVMNGQKIEKLMPAASCLGYSTLKNESFIFSQRIIYIMPNKDFYQRVLIAQYVVYLYKFSILLKYDGL